MCDKTLPHNLKHKYINRCQGRYDSPPLTLGCVAGTLSSLTGTVTEKGVNCRRLKDQLNALEREATEKLSEMEQYNKELKVSDYHRQVQQVYTVHEGCVFNYILKLQTLTFEQVLKWFLIMDDDKNSHIVAKSHLTTLRCTLCCG